ncbi:MAG: hypothetical protein H6Q38_3205 [Chloroflexi bacterium]|nr:hypothetical protein [Chloroflexota bacterium]
MEGTVQLNDIVEINEKLFVEVLVVFVLTIGLTAAASAQSTAGAPVGGCPCDQWMLTTIMDMEQHMHHHIGDDIDQNGDGWVCMYMATSVNHVHINNIVPIN